LNSTQLSPLAISHRWAATFHDEHRTRPDRLGSGRHR
jgi:hypothetical protein